MKPNALLQKLEDLTQRFRSGEMDDRTFNDGIIDAIANANSEETLALLTAHTILDKMKPQVIERVRRDLGIPPPKPISSSSSENS